MLGSYVNFYLFLLVVAVAKVQGLFTHSSTSLIRRMMMTMASSSDNPIENVGVVLLAGGQGKRMQSNVPKQFLPLLGKPVFLRSLDVFLALGSIVTDIVVVLDKSYRAEYSAVLDKADARIRFADPGKERQDSVFNGLQQLPSSCSLVAIHDAARPLVTVEEVRSCLLDAQIHGAAVLGVPMKATVKQSNGDGFVARTLDRSLLWEIHTPQIARRDLFLRGFEKVQRERLEVTDDVSVVEALGLPVKLTSGRYTNIKLTTPEDLRVAEQVLRERGLQQ